MRFDEMFRRGALPLERSEWRQLLDDPTATHWQEHRDTLLGLAQRLLLRGYAHDAFDLLPAQATPMDSGVEHLRALAMLNTGAPRAARALLYELLVTHGRDSQTLGLLGRSEKDLARSAHGETARGDCRRRAFEHYFEAFEATNDPWPGINAATLAAQLGRIKKAQSIASMVVAACEASSRDYWHWATLGEAQLILDQLDNAKASYSRFVAAHRGDHAAIASSRRQAGELLTAIGANPTFLADVFPDAHVVLFVGHRADAPERATPRLNAADYPVLHAALVRALQERAVDAAFAAAANGSDTLFLEAAQQVGVETHIVLPADVDAFKQASVLDHGDVQWSPRFDALIEACTSLSIVSEGTDLKDSETLVYGNLVTLGLARLKANQLDGQLSVISIWDGHAGEPGGTADTLAHCHELGIPIHVLSPKGEAVELDPPPKQRRRQGKRSIMGMVFADMAGYSQLTEREVEIFYGDLLVRIAEISKRDTFQVVSRQSFGDSFYFVTKSLTHSAELALALQSLFTEHDHNQQFRRAPKLRIALHAGPLLRCLDPITEQSVFTGRHTSKVARVEPVANDNQILATQQFAALLAIWAPNRYELAYAGERILPKNYGTERLFVLSRPV